MRMKNGLQYPGGKKRIAPWIIENMASHHSYIELFFGGGSVFFNKQPSSIETINDLDEEVINFFRVLQSQDTREELLRRLDYTPYARVIYDSVYETEAKDEIEKALYFAIRNAQSHGFRITEKTGWKKDVTGREGSYAVRYWNELPSLLAAMAERLKTTQIEKKPAIELIKKCNYKNVLMYADPPYVFSTRNGKQYRYEMTDADHIELLKELNNCVAKVMISGYDCKLYDDLLHGWYKLQTPTLTQNGKLRTETLWINYEPVRQLSFC